jgi:hypothetical protein
MIAAETSDSEALAGLSDDALLVAAAPEAVVATVVVVAAVVVVAFVAPAGDGWAASLKLASAFGAETWVRACA